MQNRKRHTHVQKRLLDSVGESEGGMFQENSIETCLLSRVKQITSPGWMHETNARTWCTRKTQRDRVEREVGGGSEWGIHVNPWLIHINVWQKPLQYCKVISPQLIKINEKKKKKKNRTGLSKSTEDIPTRSCFQPIICLDLKSSIHDALPTRVTALLITVCLQILCVTYSIKSHTALISYIWEVVTQPGNRTQVWELDPVMYIRGYPWWHTV